MGLARRKQQETLRDWLRWLLDQTERTIRELKVQQAWEQRRQEVARREISWKPLPSRAVESHPALHRGNCPDGKNMTSLLTEEVRIAFEQFPGLEMHERCTLARAAFSVSGTVSFLLLCRQGLAPGVRASSPP
ncbi:hypothetical protein [Streptomyces sp. NPDC093089]|uniref:hypothetical protein n=1 Tax=Streptomyces sp. NPDC093089 TaxID=3366024 RepID=UPI0037F1476A